jgi:YD repeat-containing protein
VQYSYDAGGNLTALIPPGRDAHVFEYDVLGQESAYTPPELTEGATVTRYRYNLDKELTAIERPDNKTVSLDYNSGGKLATLTIERGQYSYSYHPDTGKQSQIAAPDGSALAYNWDGFLPLSETWSGDIAHIGRVEGVWF